MSRILLVRNEQYLDLAIQDVQNFIGFERQRATKDRDIDLLAVILIPPSATAPFTSEHQSSELLRLADDTLLFSPDSVSVNGMWLLLTVSQPELLEPTSRQVALAQILSILRTKGYVQSLNTVFPVFSLEEKTAITEQMSYLVSVYPGLPVANALSIDLQEHSGKELVSPMATRGPSMQR